MTETAYEAEPVIDAPPRVIPEGASPPRTFVNGPGVFFDGTTLAVYTGTLVAPATMPDEIPATIPEEPA